MKVNDKGRPCPAWCRIDHEAEADRSCYGRELTVKAEPSVAGAEASLGAYQKEPEISGLVTVQNASGAERLAQALEAAADLTKPKLRQLAAQVRVAAVEAWPEQDKEAEAG